jgi:soluble lytic murein transglycosylase
VLAAEAHFRQKKNDKTLTNLEAIKDKRTPLAHRVSYLKAQAFLAKGAWSKAASAYRSHLKHYPDAPAAVWIDTAEALARLGERKEAARHFRQLLVRFPHSASARKAARELKRFKSSLRVLTGNEQLDRLRSQFKGQWHKAALRTAARVQKRNRRQSHAWCDAAFFKARILEKQKEWSQAAAAFGEGVAHCQSSPRFIELLYFGAKRHLRAGNLKLSRLWFNRVLKEDPEHSYVDDSQRWLARIYRQQGKAGAARHLLRSVMGSKVGDMQEDAAWDLLWPEIEAGKYKLAEKLAIEATESIARELKSYTRGRLQYWRGRMAEKLGKKVPAALAYARCIRDYPLTYYGYLAGKRLSNIDKQSAAEAVNLALKGNSGRSILESSNDRLNDPKLKRAVSLLRLGLQSFARREFAKLGLQHSRNPADTWLMAMFYKAAGQHTRSYRMARKRQVDTLSDPPVGVHRERWELAYPRPEIYAAFVKAAAKKHGIESSLVWAVMRHESAFRSTAVSFANAVGLMQLIIPTGSAMAKQEGLRGPINRKRLQEPELNIKLGSRYLGKLSKRFEGHPVLIAAGYNAGPGRPATWLKRKNNEEMDLFVERIPFRETRRYTKSVVTSYLRYRYLYEGADPPSVAIRLPRVE